MIVYRRYYKAIMLTPKGRLGSRMIDDNGTTAIDKPITTWFITVERILLSEP